MSELLTKVPTIPNGRERDRGEAEWVLEKPGLESTKYMNLVNLPMLHSATVRKMTAVAKTNEHKAATASLKSSIKEVFAKNFFAGTMANGQGENPEPVEEAEQKGPFGKQKAKHGNFAGFSDHEKKVYEVTISSIEGVVGGVGGESRAVTALDDVLAALMYAAWHVECARSATDAPIRSMSKMSEIQEWFQKGMTNPVATLTNTTNTRMSCRGSLRFAIS